MAETYQNESLVIPSRAQFHWKSSRVGDDVVEILPSDEHFCFDCSYIVTVEGWSNTSYTRTSILLLYFPCACTHITLTHLRPHHPKHKN